MNWYKQAQFDWNEVVKGFGMTVILGLAAWWGISALEVKNEFEKNPEKVIEKLEEVKNNPNIGNFGIEEKKEDIIDNTNNYLNDTKEMIIRHEGKENSLYYVNGVPHIGIGFNLTKESAPERLSSLGININNILNNKQSLTDEQIMNLFNNDLQIAINDAKHFIPNFNEQPDTVKSILINMAFNMGYPSLSGFEDFRKALINKNYNEAAKEMIDSEWHRENQVGNRSQELITLMQGI